MWDMGTRRGDHETWLDTSIPVLLLHVATPHRSTLAHAGPVCGRRLGQTDAWPLSGPSRKSADLTAGSVGAAGKRPQRVNCTECCVQGFATLFDCQVNCDPPSQQADGHWWGHSWLLYLPPASALCHCA